MKAVVHSAYGGPGVLQLADVEMPVHAPNEMLVTVHAAALNPVDWHFVRGAPYPLPADRVVVHMPERVTFEQAAGVPLAGLTALQVLRDKAQVRSGHRLLIVGAAGGIGTFAIQLAKVLGADVTGVQSTAALDLVRSLGADCVIDYE